MPCFIALVALLISGCTTVVVPLAPSSDGGPDPYADAGYVEDGGSRNLDAGTDASPPPPVDAGTDSGPVDAGTDAGMDAGPLPCDCPDDGNPCTSDFCDAENVCVHTSEFIQGTFCLSDAGVSGICRGDLCCDGCWDGVACRDGTAISFCGAAGGLCGDCDGATSCSLDVCSPVLGPTKGGTCQHTSQNHGEACDDGAGDGICRVGTCEGCGGLDERCCIGGTCGTDLLCNASSCEPCGALDERCCDTGDACVDGTVCDGTAFEPHCESCGGQDEPCCDSGDACGANLECNVGGTCSCGWDGEICCPGSSCPNARLCFNGLCVGDP